MSVTVKISLDSDIRRLAISSCSYTAFEELVRKLYTESIPDHFVVKYQDEENDLVSITSDRELAEAIHFAAGKPLLRLFIVETKPKQARTAPSVVAEPAPAPVGGFDALHRIIDQALDCPELRDLIGAFGLTPEGVRKIIANPLDQRQHATCTAAAPSAEEKEKEKELPRSVEQPEAEHDAICDHCDQPIRGIRFKCTLCPDYDLCEACEKLLPFSSVHDPQHLFLKVYTPVRLPSRRQLLPNFYEREAQWTPGPGCRWAGGCRRRWGGRGPHHWRGHCNNTGDNGAAPEGAAPAPAPGAAPEPWCRWRWQRPGAPRWLSSRFIADVTINDGTQMAPRTPFRKVWRLCNSGTTEWPANTSLSFVSGDALCTEQSVSVDENPVAPGQEVDIAVDMVAPDQAGRYITNWRLTTPDGIAFGHRVWADILVVPSAAEEPKKEATASAPVAVPPAAVEEKKEEPVPAPPSAATLVVVAEEKKEESAPAAVPAPPVDPLAEQLAALAAMGFTDIDANRRALLKRKGDIVRAVHDLLG